jgi:hypothetical protein
MWHPFQASYRWLGTTLKQTSNIIIVHSDSLSFHLPLSSASLKAVSSRFLMRFFSLVFNYNTTCIFPKTPSKLAVWDRKEFGLPGRNLIMNWRNLEVSLISVLSKLKHCFAFNIDNTLRSAKQSVTI